MVTIAEAFARAKQEERLALIGYLPAGYPDSRAFITLAQHAFSAGLDILEIGLPSPNPRFDGVVIQKAVKQVIEQGLDTQTALELGGEALAGSAGSGLAMFYPESLYEYGTARLLASCQKLGISGILPVGMETAEWQLLAKAATEKELTSVGFITHDMDQQIVGQVAKTAGGFLYLQSQDGPTGQQGEFGDEIRARIAEVKTAARINPLPVAVGFGVRQPNDVERIRALGADGVIVGTAFVEAAAQGIGALEELVQSLAGVAKFV